MNLDDQKKTGTNQISVTDSLEAPLLSIKVKRTSSTTVPSGTSDLIVYVDTSPKSTPSANRKQFLFELSSVLGFASNTSDEFVTEVTVDGNDIKSVAYVTRKVNGNTVLSTPTIEELGESLITLFEGTNYIYTNYTNDSIELIYPKNDELNRRYLNNALFAYHRMNSSGDFSLDDIYFKDAFTKTDDNLNLEINNLEISTLSSKNNSFSLDTNGNLVVNTITTNSSSGSSTDLSEIYNHVYPVGCVYISTIATSPAVLFGGTWEQLKDRFLLGVGDIYNNNTIGGESTHTLTINEIPSHSHKQRYITNDFGQEGTSGNWTFARATGTNSVNTFDAGGGQAHNNMPPYLTVYIWKRTAL